MNAVIILVSVKHHSRPIMMEQFLMNEEVKPTIMWATTKVLVI